MNTQPPANEPPVVAPPDFHPRQPKIGFPPLACDSHAHSCGPIARYPYYARRIYTPADTLLPDYEHMLKTIGVQRAALVQGSIYGTDNTVLLEALKAGNGRYRGVAVVAPEVSETELRRLHDAGVRGALSAGFRIDDKWTFELGASSNQMFDSHSTLSSGGPISNTDFITNFSFQNLDFNAAFAPVLSDKFDLKLFGGIRSLHYTDTQDKMGSDSSGGGHTYQGYYTAEFIGAGPRIGVSGSARFGDSPLGVSGLLSAALIYGEERVHSSYNFTSGGSGSGTITVPSSTEWKSIYDIEASLGLDYHVNPQTMFTLGVRSEQISGVASGLAKGGPTTRLVYGPFAKVSGSF